MTDFEEVYRQYFTGVYQYVRALCGRDDVAEEVTQETFFKALSAIDRFDGRCRLYVWLCQIAKNTYFTHYRRARRETELQQEQQTVSLEENLESRDTAEHIFRVLQRLEEPYREVFSLRVLGEQSFAQIAALHGKTESWARVTFHRAKLKIREELA